MLGAGGLRSQGDLGELCGMSNRVHSYYQQLGVGLGLEEELCSSSQLSQAFALVLPHFFLKAQVGQRPHKNILRGCLLQVLPLGNAPHPGAQESVWQVSFTSFGVSSDFSQEHGSQHCLPHLLSSQWVTDVNVRLGLYMSHFKGHTYPVCLKLQPYVQRFIWQADP